MKLLSINVSKCYIKIKNGQIDNEFNFVTNSDVHQYNTRSKNDFHLKKV